MALRNTGGRTPPMSAGPRRGGTAATGTKRAANICVFCGSSAGKAPVYTSAAQRLGTLIGERNWCLVFGGGGIGLMGEVARAARDAGAPIIGILPAFLRHLEPPLRSAEELVLTPDLQQRKARMLALADAFVILPGGLGTLDEYFEVVTTAQLRVHAKPIVVVNTEDYFAPLAALLKHLVAKGFAREEIEALHSFVATPEEAVVALSSRLGLPQP